MCSASSVFFHADVNSDFESSQKGSIVIDLVDNVDEA